MIYLFLMFLFFLNFFLVIKLKALKFTFSVLFRTQILPDILVKVVQLSLHLYELIKNRYNN